MKLNLILDLVFSNFMSIYPRIYLLFELALLLDIIIEKQVDLRGA